ncbi:neutral zinc metallopeptidase [Nocardiopsis lambiniae]|uniref:Neutral zinc metallopeptidase n=1 Tax=Nocardiopsis lambiniae TaxID=3075539 RepID=A0ABU2M6I8_9ACTN|nr:neutral zinc metallopeptidase [Nocardiopsis sp. DSM 44743]MDT0328277.1 neutral zinc metallopeptidase [Nocardiopsis sp. DSM 44743]
MPEHARRARRTDQRVFTLVTGLLVALLALTLLSWTTAGDPSDERASEALEDWGADSDEKSGWGPSGGERSGPLPGMVEEPDRPSGYAALVANPLYGTGRLSPLPCPAPELDVTDQDSMEAFLHRMADCLDDAWSTQFERAGIPFTPPQRVFWDEPGASPCRTYPSQAGAFYCRASASIYIGTGDVVEKWNGTRNGAVYVSLLAHEYGHHVQGESGLLEYYHEQRQLEEDERARNSWTRRSELQANCLAGAFLGSVRVGYPLTDDDLETLITDAKATADRADGPEEERTHGSAENSARWMLTGWEEQTPGACNTWGVADLSLVE